MLRASCGLAVPVRSVRLMPPRYDAGGHARKGRSAQSRPHAAASATRQGLATGNASDALLALKDGKFITLRVPYPMGFYAKGLDGRIDDPKAGWKGRGLWSASGDRTPWLNELGKGARPMAVHIQVRPNPLAN